MGAVLLAPGLLAATCLGVIQFAGLTQDAAFVAFALWIFLLVPYLMVMPGVGGIIASAVHWAGLALVLGFATRRTTTLRAFFWALASVVGTGLVALLILSFFGHGKVPGLGEL